VIAVNLDYVTRMLIETSYCIGTVNATSLIARYPVQQRETVSMTRTEVGPVVPGGGIAHVLASSWQWH